MILLLALLAILLTVLYSTAVVFHRLYLSPIAHFPGPKFAAATWAYQFYYDVILQGRYVFKIKELHDKYGPVVRITPGELHVIDPAFMDVLYTSHVHKRDKWSFYTEVFAVPGASMNTNSHDLHRIRRSALNPFFSKASIRKLQPVIDARVDRLLDRLAEFQQSGDILIMNHASSAFTNDVAAEFAFGKSHDRLGDPKFDPTFHDNAKAGAAMLPFLAHFPIIMRTLEALPEKLVTTLSPDYARFLDERVEIQEEARKAMISGQDPSSLKDGQTYRTIFHEIIDSKGLPAEEKLPGRLADEAAVTMAAGTLTTAWILTVTIYFLLANPSILEKLKTELETAISNISNHEALATIESLPYLRACIQEGIRLGYGAPGRVAHIAPDEAMVVNCADNEGKAWVIPPGTPTSMTVYLMHHVESIFPDSKTYRPERWIDNPRLDKHLFAFSKGTRSCVGMNLAYAELSLAVARIFRSYGSKDCRHPQDKGYLELFETGYRDVELVGTLVLPKMWNGTKGVRLHVRK